MVNAARTRLAAAMAVGAAVLVAAAWLRGAEYDEQYTLFLTAGTPRPVWPDWVFQAELVQRMQAPGGDLWGVARDLRATDVHPPLYFWAVWLWRRLAGPGLMAARWLSVLFGIASLGLVARIARLCGRPQAASVLITACCYGFAYTSTIARGFALAEMCLLGGVALLLMRRSTLAGAAFGLACAANYLAVFPAVAVCLAARAWRAVPLALPFLALDAWFFAAQHGTRDGQFPPFDLGASLLRLTMYQMAAVFGGLPLYWHGAARIVALLVVCLGALALVVRCRREGGATLLLAGAAAPALGLLLLGAVFNNTPIELRYLSFGLPFIALLASGQGPGRTLVLGVQAAGIAGLLLAPRTMQPARGAAAKATFYASDALVLLPYGNDGVGIPGAFGLEAPAGTALRLVRAGDGPVGVPREYRRVVLALLGQDQDSVASLKLMRDAVSGSGWRRVAIGSNVEVYERTGAGG